MFWVRYCPPADVTPAEAPRSSQTAPAPLVATAPGENDSEGCAWVFSGTSRGLTTDGSWTFSGRTIDASVDSARFGSSVAQ